jgi:hypothetical protein
MTRKQLIRDFPLAMPEGNPTHTPTHLRVTVAYQKAGTNWAHGDEERGGYYAHVKAVEKMPDGIIRYVLFINGFKVYVAPAKRFSAKRFADAVGAVEEGLDNPETATGELIHGTIGAVLEQQQLTLA